MCEGGGLVSLFFCYRQHQIIHPKEKDYKGKVNEKTLLVFH